MISTIPGSGPDHDGAKIGELVRLLPDRHVLSLELRDPLKQLVPKRQRILAALHLRQ
jgi:hypothetical protein